MPHHRTLLIKVAKYLIIYRIKVAKCLVVAPVEDGGGLQVGPVFRREKSWGCLVVVGILKDFFKFFPP